MVRPLRFIGNLLRGRYRHWNNHNNRYIAELWRRTEQMPSPISKVMQRFVVCSVTVVEQLIGPDTDRLLDIDPLHLQSAQFAKLYGVVLEYLVGTFVKINPTLKDDLLGALVILTGLNPTRSRMLNFAMSENGIDAGALGREAWQCVLEVTGCSEHEPTKPMFNGYSFTVFIGSMAVSAFEDVRREFEATACQE